ncbi:MAG TPA: glycosyltransferase [Flavobacterium sp.]|nr:glycosyltransferase [Flavobacterium sp.]
MNQLPLVSIICLCYNHEQYVLASLNSVLNQSYKNIEIIIVDDNSTDNSVEIIEKWIEGKNIAVQFIKHETNIGNNTAFNHAVKTAKGNYLIDFATDDVLLKDAVEIQIDTFLKNPDASLVFGNAEVINEEGQFLHYFFTADENKKVIGAAIKNTTYESILQGGNCMCSVSSMIKRSYFEKINGYDEELFYEDLDLWLRLSRISKFVFIDQPLVQKRIVENSQSSFFKKNKNDYALKINKTTYKVLKKAFLMNHKKSEYKALLKRIHHEIEHNIDLKNYALLLRLIILKIKTEYKIRITN